MEKHGRREATGGKVLPCFLVSPLSLAFAYINRRKSGIACSRINVNSCSIFLPVDLCTGAVSLSFLFIPFGFCCCDDGEGFVNISEVQSELFW